MSNPEDTTKQHDAEEARSEQAARLTDKRMDSWQEANRRLREHFRLHLRHLSTYQRKHVAAFLRKESETTIKLVEDSTDDMPRLGLTRLPDGDWS